MNEIVSANGSVWAETALDGLAPGTLEYLADCEARFVAEVKRTAMFFYRAGQVLLEPRAELSEPQWSAFVNYLALKYRLDVGTLKRWARAATLPEATVRALWDAELGLGVMLILEKLPESFHEEIISRIRDGEPLTERRVKELAREVQVVRGGDDVPLELVAPADAGEGTVAVPVADLEALRAEVAELRARVAAQPEVVAPPPERGGSHQEPPHREPPVKAKEDDEPGEAGPSFLDLQLAELESSDPEFAAKIRRALENPVVGKNVTPDDLFRRHGGSVTEFLASLLSISFGQPIPNLNRKKFWLEMGAVEAGDEGKVVPTRKGTMAAKAMDAFLRVFDYHLGLGDPLEDGAEGVV